MEVHSELGLLRGKMVRWRSLFCTVRSCVKRQQKPSNFLFQRDYTILHCPPPQRATNSSLHLGWRLVTRAHHKVPSHYLSPLQFGFNLHFPGERRLAKFSEGVSQELIISRKFTWEAFSSQGTQLRPSSWVVIFC